MRPAPRCASKRWPPPTGYVTTLAQAFDELRASTKRPEVVRWALDNKIATANAAFTNATEAGDGAALLDMLVYATLKRQGVEDHWLPNLLGPDEGAGVLEAHRRAEQEVWSRGAKMLTRKQLEELTSLIEQWRRDHPAQYYVSHIRLADIAAAKQLTSGSPQLKLPGSVFSLLYMDPLSGLDPMAAELHGYRALTERMMFLAQRMPLVFGAQVERATLAATSTPEMLRVVAGIEKFNGEVERFTNHHRALHGRDRPLHRRRRRLPEARVGRACGGDRAGVRRRRRGASAAAINQAPPPSPPSARRSSPISTRRTLGSAASPMT